MFLFSFLMITVAWEKLQRLYIVSCVIHFTWNSDIAAYYTHRNLTARVNFILAWKKEKKKKKNDFSHEKHSLDVVFNLPGKAHLRIIRTYIYLLLTIFHSEIWRINMFITFRWLQYGMTYGIALVVQLDHRLPAEWNYITTPDTRRTYEVNRKIHIILCNVLILTDVERKKKMSKLCCDIFYIASSIEKFRFFPFPFFSGNLKTLCMPSDLLWSE